MKLNNSDSIIRGWENNPSAKRIIREWLRKATKDAGNYYTRLLEDIGFCFDTRSGADWGCEPPASLTGEE